MNNKEKLPQPVQNKKPDWINRYVEKNSEEISTGLVVLATIAAGGGIFLAYGS